VIQRVKTGARRRTAAEIQSKRDASLEVVRDCGIQDPHALRILPARVAADTEGSTPSCGAPTPFLKAATSRRNRGERFGEPLVLKRKPCIQLVNLPQKLVGFPDLFRVVALQVKELVDLTA